MGQVDVILGSAKPNSARQACPSSTPFTKTPSSPSPFSTIPRTMLAASLLAVALAVVGANAQLTINTPVGLVTCQNSQLSWTGNTGPVQITYALLCSRCVQL